MDTLAAGSGFQADGGLLLLRLAVGSLIIGHAVQKSLGWLGGDGLEATATVFDRVGYRPGRLMVIIAATSEIVGSVLLILGLLTPIAGAMLVGVMIVACSVHWQFGVWSANRGFELPLTFAVAAAALCLVGPGGWSLDNALGLSFPSWLAPVGLLVGCLGAAGAIRMRAWNLRSVANGAM